MIEDEQFDDDSSSDFMNEKDMYDDSMLDGSLDSMPLPTPMMQHSDLLKWLMNQDEYIEKLKYEWMAVRVNKKGRLETIKGCFPLVNFRGANRGGEILKSYLKPNTFLSNIRVQDYNDIMKDVVDEVWFTFGFNMGVYGIKNKENLKSLCTQIENTIKILLAGSIGGNYLKVITTTTQRHENVMLDPRQQMENPYAFKDYNNPQMNQQENKGMIGRFFNKLMNH